MLQYSQIPEFLDTAARSTFERDIQWKMSDFFRTKSGFKKCILCQIELIKHWNENTNFSTACLNFKLELTEHIRNRNSIFVGLVYTSVYWLRLCIRFYDSGKENKDITNVVFFNNIKYIERLSGILISSIVFYGFESLAL